MIIFQVDPVDPINLRTFSCFSGLQNKWLLYKAVLTMYSLKEKPTVDTYEKKEDAQLLKI